MAAVITICSDFGAQKIKSYTVYTVSPSISHEVMGLDVMISIFWMLSFKLQGLLYSARTNVPKIIKKERNKEGKRSLLKGCSAQFSHSFMSNSLLSHEPQQTRPPCPSPTPMRLGVNPCPLISNTMQTSHALTSPSPPALNLSQHQNVWNVSSSHQVAKLLEFQLQYQSFQWTLRTGFL